MKVRHGRALSLGIAALVLVACGGGGGSDAGAPVATPRISGAGSIAFGGHVVGTSSTPQSIVLTNTGGAPWVISNIAASAQFAASGTCGGSIAPTATCTLTVTFTPAASGSVTGSITITSNAPGAAYVVSLSGTGLLASSWVQGQYSSSRSFEDRCASPRTGINTATGLPFPDVRGSALDEKNWLRSWTNELYLWYDEVVDRDPAPYSTPEAYFDVLKSPTKDRFHFTYPTDFWLALSQTGITPGYGASFVLLASTPPRNVVIAYTEPGSPAVAAGLTRGTKILAIDGVDAVNATSQANVNTLNAGLFPETVGATHSFSVLDPGASSARTVSMTSANVASFPVQSVKTLATGSGAVGYMLFNDHIATSETALVSAFNTLKNAAVTDLVLDVRYNGGGYLDIASEVAYMIAGAAATAGKTFEVTQFNNKYPGVNPVTGQATVPIGFHNTSIGLSVAAGQALPTLNLSRVYVLTSADTCSASESIINSLRGIDVQVIQIGSRTCGKPYGFYPWDNCGTTYFSIQFKGVNAKGFGDYTTGFSPANATSNPGVALPGCSIADDFTHSLGDAAEGRLSAALYFRANGSCPTPPSGAGGSQAPTLDAGYQPPVADGVVQKPEWLRNRTLR